MSYCNEPFEDFISNCGDTLIINTILDPATAYKVRLNRFNYSAGVDVTTDTDGKLIIQKTSLPDGFLNPYSGVIRIEVFAADDESTPIAFKIANSYKQIDLEIENGSFSKSEIGVAVA